MKAPGFVAALDCTVRHMSGIEKPDRKVRKLDKILGENPENKMKMVAHSVVSNVQAFWPAMFRPKEDDKMGGTEESED